MGPVAPALAAIAPYLGTAATAYGAYSSYKAGKDAEKLQDKETAENMRRAAAEDKASMAETRARIAASGVQTAGSSALYLKEKGKEDSRQLDWMKKAGDYRGDALRDQGTSGAIGSLAKIPGYWT